MEQNFNPGLALIGLSGTRPRGILKNTYTSDKFHQKALNCKLNRQTEIAMCFKEGWPCEHTIHPHDASMKVMKPNGYITIKLYKVTEAQTTTTAKIVLRK